MKLNLTFFSLPYFPRVIYTGHCNFCNFLCTTSQRNIHLQNSIGKVLEIKLTSTNFVFLPHSELSLGVKLYKRVKLNENIWEYCLFYWEAGCQNQNITAVHKSQVKPLRWFLSYDILVFHWCCDSICSIYWQLSHLFLSFQKKISLSVPSLCQERSSFVTFKSYEVEKKMNLKNQDDLKQW